MQQLTLMAIQIIIIIIYYILLNVKNKSEIIF